MPLSPLPVDSHLAEILKSIQEFSSVILKASPGSGKTTRVPPAVLRADFLPPNSEILVLEPRRLAAKLACLRVVEELELKLGEEVGYHFRAEKRTGPKTRLTFLTEGLLLRRCLSDRNLKNVSLVVLDEFHERHLQTDVALSYLKFLQNSSRPDLKLLVMSATLDTSPLEAFLNASKVLEIDAPPFPLEVRYAEGATLEKSVLSQMRNLKGLPSLRHTLVFLPGMREIRKTEETLLQNGFQSVFVLHGELSKEEQERALSKSSSNKIILTTNIAESSVTIDGVNTVLDSGLERVASLSPWTGLTTLSTKATSKASAIQRAGRAARQGPGLCVRLFSTHDFETKPAFQLPEIKRADLSQTFLELSALGIEDFENFPWYEKPAPNQMKGSFEVLENLGAIDKNGITPLGRKMADLPLPPRLSALVINSEQQNCLEPAVRLAALLSEGELHSLDALQDIAASPSYRVKSTEQRLLAQFPKFKNTLENLPVCVLHAFPDRVGRRRLENKKASKFVEIVMATGGTVLAEEKPFLLEHEFFVVIDAQETKRSGSHSSQNFARSLMGIEEAHLLDVPGSLLSETEELSWDTKTEKVVSRSLLKYGQLVLEEKSRPVEAGEAGFEIFSKERLGKKSTDLTWSDLVQSLSSVDKEEIESLITRVLFVAKAKNWEVASPETVAKVLYENWGQRRDINWLELLKITLLPQNFSSLERLAPSHFELHKKRRAKINYALDKTPWIESRLQDFFGLKVNPAVLEGTVPLVLHLQAPNYRAVQVTQDLKGFWEKHYPALRQELSRRYPRHKWPENPLLPPEDSK